VERRDLALADIEAITRQEVVYVSPVNIAEIFTGIQLVPDQNKKLRGLSFLKKLGYRPIIQINARTGLLFGEISAHLRRTGAGVDFRTNDLWLAVQALQRDLKFITLNAKHFRDIPKLRIIEL
jgi:predicted nucleic acid-binding protein